MFHSPARLLLSTAMLLVLMLAPVGLAKGNAIDYLEWQVARGGAEHSAPVARFRAGSAEKSTLKTRALPFTGEVTVTGKAGQLFVICAHRVDPEGFAGRAVAAESTASGEINVYLLALARTSGELSIHNSRPCPSQLHSQYPFHSAQHLRSQAPFLLVQKQTINNQTSNELPFPQGASATAHTTEVLLSGGSSHIGNDNDFKRKRPPFMPALDKATFDLLLLPTLNLPANWQEYLPFARVYHWLTDHNPAGLTILVRFNDQPPVRLQVSQAEYTDIAGYLLSARQLLNWLAPKLNGREYLVQQMLELLSGEYETVLAEETLEAVQRQLAIVLEQPDTEFSLEFEYSEWLQTLAGQETKQQPPGIHQLGGVQSRATQSTASTSDNEGQSSSGASSGRQGSFNPQWQANRLYPGLYRGGAESGQEVLVDTPIDYVIRMHQTEYRISRQQALAFINIPVSQSGLRLFCEDCRQSGITVEEMTAHAETHWLTCPKCQQFRPGATTYIGRCNMLAKHTQSQCESFRGAVPVSPLPDDSLTVLRFMFRFGTEQTLLDLLKQPDLPITSALLLETDQYRKTLLHDLTQYATEPVIKRFMLRYKRLMTSGALSIQDTGRNTPLHSLFKIHSESLSLAVINYLGRPMISQLLTLQDGLGDTLLHILVEQKYFKAFSEILWFLSILPDDSLRRRLLILQNNNGLSLLHSIFSNTDISRISHFIDQWAQVIIPEALATEALGGETPLHRLFEKVPSPGVNQLLERFLDHFAMHLSQELLSKKRRSDGNTPLHLLFAKANPELTRKLLDKCYLHLGREVAFTTNKAGESILQTLLQNSNPATAMVWLHQGNPERRQIFKALLNTNPVMDWPKLLRRASVYEALVPQLGWVKETLDPEQLSSQTSQKQQAALSVTRAYAQCPVCLDSMQDDCVNTACCRNLLHRSCITQSLKYHSYCPLCNQPTQIGLLETIRMPHIVVEKVDNQKKVETRPEARGKEGRTELHIAVMDGHFDDVLKLIEQGADREAKDRNGFTPIHYAMAYHRIEILELLASVYKVNLDVTTKEGNTPLHLAVAADDEQCIELLMKYGANPDVRTNEGDTPLHLAAAWNNTQAIRQLALGKADLEAKNYRNKFTPLHVAVGFDHIEASVALIHNGANKEALTKEETTPLGLAIYHDKTKTALALVQEGASIDNLEPSKWAKLQRWLREAGITPPFAAKPQTASTTTHRPAATEGLAEDINAADERGRTQLHHAAWLGNRHLIENLTRQGANLETQDEDGETPLHMAAWMGNTQTAVALIQQGANLEAQDKYGETPLHKAAQRGKTETAVALIQQGANPEAQNKYGETPLHMAAQRGETEIAVALIQQRANLEAQNKGGQTPLHMAAQMGETEIAVALIQQRANLEAQNKGGQTPLHMAAQMGEMEIAVALIQQRANLEAQDKGGETPLHMAAQMGKTETAVALIQQRANLEAQDEDGETPLHKAAQKGKTETAVALIQQRANLEAQDEDGETPLHKAAQKGKTETAVALAQRGAEIQSLPPGLSAKVKQWLHEAGIPFPVIHKPLAAKPKTASAATYRTTVTGKTLAAEFTVSLDTAFGERDTREKQFVNPQ